MTNTVLTSTKTPADTRPIGTSTLDTKVTRETLVVATTPKDDSTSNALQETTSINATNRTTSDLRATKNPCILITSLSTATSLEGTTNHNTYNINQKIT